MYSTKSLVRGSPKLRQKTHLFEANTHLFKILSRPLIMMLQHYILNKESYERVDKAQTKTHTCFEILSQPLTMVMQHYILNKDSRERIHKAQGRTLFFYTRNTLLLNPPCLPLTLHKVRFWEEFGGISTRAKKLSANPSFWDRLETYFPDYACLF